MQINFGDIISRSFRIAWQYKSLWVFGLFTYSSGGTYNLDLGDVIKPAGDSVIEIGDNAFSYSDPVVVGFLLWLIFFGVLMFLCAQIAMPALIDGINKITRGGQYRFGESFSRGLDFFLRFLGMNILLFIAIVTLVIIVAIPVAITPISLLLTIPIGIVLAFFLFHTFGLAEVAMVARDGNIIDSLAEGFTLTKQNIGNCILMTLILIGLGIIFGIITMIFALITFAPANLLLSHAIGDLVAIIFLGFLVGLPVSLVIGGFMGTFFNSAYIQFYFNLVDPPQPVPQTAGDAPYYGQ